MKTTKTPKEAPKGCTCIWTTSLSQQGEAISGAVFISMGTECPAYPHDRRWSRAVTR